MFISLNSSLRFSPVGQRNWTGNDATNSNECFAGRTSDSFSILIVKYYLLFSAFFQNFYPKRNFTTVRILLTRRVKCDVKLWENRPLRWCFYAFKGFFYDSQNISRNLWSFSILQKSFSCCLKIPVDSFDIM